MSLPAVRAETCLATMYTGEHDVALLTGLKVKVLSKTQMKLQMISSFPAALSYRIRLVRAI